MWGVPAATSHVQRHAVGVLGTGVMVPSIQGNSMVMMVIMQGGPVGVKEFHVVVWGKLGGAVVGPSAVGVWGLVVGPGTVGVWGTVLGPAP